MSYKVSDNLLKETKQFLSIIESATAKDLEIKTLIGAGIEELKRAGIDVKYNKPENEDFTSLVKTAIIMYVKANFGNTDIKEKELCMRTFNSLEQSLSLSEGHKESGSDV